MRRTRVAALLTVVGAMSAGAQATPKSQQATVSQQVAAARIDIRYRRPVARGRAIFGGLVPYGHMWTPSADSAAKFTVSSAIMVNGAALAAGSYSMWAIPDSASWTIVFSSRADVFHLRYPDGQDVLRVKAVPTRGDHTESLLFDFPMVDADSATLHLRWGTTIVPLSIKAMVVP